MNFIAFIYTCDTLVPCIATGGEETYEWQRRLQRKEEEFKSLLPKVHDSLIGLSECIGFKESQANDCIQCIVSRFYVISNG